MFAALKLRECRLWWPAWQQGIPFTDYGYGNEVSGAGYSFKVDPDMDSWLMPSGALMPINGATLKSCSTASAILYRSFSIMGRKVQVNTIVDPKNNTYSVRFYDIDDLYFYGEAYREDE